MANLVTESRCLQDLLECSICSEEFTDPRILPCIHTFCLVCLEKAGQNKQPGEIMPCPVCRTEFTIPDQGFVGIPKNFFMETLKDVNSSITPGSAGSNNFTPGSKNVMCDACLDDAAGSAHSAVMSCVTCEQKLCDDCGMWHKRNKASKEHQLIALIENQTVENQVSEKTADQFCDSHKSNPIEMYCLDCKSTICVTCLDGSHHGHKCYSIAKASEGFRQQLEESITRISKCSNSTMIRLCKLNEKITLLSFRSSSLQSEVLRHANHLLKEIVDRHAEALITEIDAIKTENIEEMVRRKEELFRHLNMLDSYKKYARKLVENGSTIDICRNIQDMNSKSEQLKDDLHHEFADSSDDPTLFFCRIDFPDLWKRTDRNVIGKLTLDDARMVEKFNIDDEDFVPGLTHFEDKVYVVCAGRIRVFRDHEPFKELSEITMEKLRYPSDITASKVSRSIFVGDSRKFLWQVELTDNEFAIRCKRTVGKPDRLSTTQSGEFIIAVELLTAGKYFINLYRSSDVESIMSVPLPTEVKSVCHAVQSSNGHFIVIHANSTSPDLFLISELSVDGKKFIRTFDPRSAKTNPSFINWCPVYLCILEDDKIIVADLCGNRVLLLNSELTDCILLLDQVQHEINCPRRMCYIQDQHKLIVGQENQRSVSTVVQGKRGRRVASVSFFSILTPRMKRVPKTFTSADK